jgi:hypothetical protein
MTDAGQLQPDDTIWHNSKVWWMTERLSTGEVVFSDDPTHGQIRALVLDPHEDVVRASQALLDARGEHMEAVAKMRRSRRSLDFEIAAQQDRRAVAVIEVLEAAGVIARYEP